MIQIIVQKEINGKTAFVYPDKKILAPSLSELFRNLQSVLDQLKPDEKVNTFYTVGHHLGAGTGAQPQRTNASFDYQTVLAFDFDGADVNKAIDYAKAVAEVIEAPTDALTVIKSGGGVHVLAGLRTPLRHSKTFKELKPAYRMLCEEITRRCEAKGLPGYADSAIFDAARVLRLPGTINRKKSRGTDLPCELVQIGNATLDLDLAEVSGFNKVKKENVSPEDIKRQYPKPDFKEIVKECSFIKWCHDEVKQVHEPDAFDLFSLLHYQPEDARGQLGGKDYTPKELSQYIYENATSSSTLTKETLEKKLEQAGKYGSRTCRTINDRWGQCQKCPHFGKINSPLALKSKEHISSEETGYWVLDQKGRRIKPNYADLERVFRREHHYKVTAEERVLCYERTHYTEWQRNQIKSWLEDTVTPNDPLIEGHRAEMVAKIRATNVLGEMAIKRFFEGSIQGKLNCSNGVVDVMTGILHPHSPDYGFMSVLPYEYVEGENPEFFLNWLEVISQGSPERMNMLLSQMEFVLVPSFDDHVFTYLTGTGGNGKSTFMEVLKALVGKDNYTSASLGQLCENRFAPAQLEGKLLNISEEESGTNLGVKELNFIKNASAGGTMLVERKGSQMYEMRNSAKLVFSANKIPRFEDDTDSVKRRLVVIEFNYQIPAEQRDPRTLDRIIAEMPAILSLLIRRIKANIERNGGVYKFERGGEVGNQAREKFMTANSTALMFAQERMECDPEFDEKDCIATSEAYGLYQDWCHDNGHKYPVAKENFAKTINGTFIHPKVRNLPNLKRIGGKPTRVFVKTRWKQDEDIVL